MREIYLILVGFESNDFCGHVAEEALVQEFIKLGQCYTKLYQLYDPCVMGFLQLYLNDIVEYEKKNVPVLTLHLYLSKWAKFFKLLLNIWDDNPFTRLHLIQLQKDDSLAKIKDYTIQCVLNELQDYLAHGRTINISYLPYFLEKDAHENMVQLHKIKTVTIGLTKRTINHQINQEYQVAKQELKSNSLYLLFLNLKSDFYFCNNTMLLDEFSASLDISVLAKYFNSDLLSQLKCRVENGSLSFDLVWPLEIFTTSDEIYRLSAIHNMSKLLYVTDLEMQSRYHPIRSCKSVKAHYFVAKHVLNSLMNSLDYCNKDELKLAELSQFFLKIKQICESINLFLVAVDYALVPTNDVLLNAKRLVENQNDLLVLRQAEMTKLIDDSYNSFVKESQVDVVRQLLMFYDFNHFFLMSKN